MKIKIVKKDYGEVVATKPSPREKPQRPDMLFRTLLKLVSLPDLIATGFTCKSVGMEKIGKKEPCLFLMNHSSFIDLEIVSSVLYPRSFNIVATNDCFIGKSALMHHIGCIPTAKFAFDLQLVRDMNYAIKKLSSSVVLYPEASYSFDGTATALPDTVGKCVKMLGVPVVMIRTYGAFARDPLYNNLQRRRVKVSAVQECVFTKEEVERLSADEIQKRLNELFTFDHFRWQAENSVEINEPFRADYLNRVLYKCPHCLAEGRTVGKGETLKCTCCGKEYRLTELGRLEALSGDTAFEYVSDWYAWEREQVRKEIIEGSYRVELPVDICMTIDTKKLYSVGEGKLLHNAEGFELTGCGGRLNYSRKVSASYSLYSDYNWYEVGDMVCIGDAGTLYYCFPKVKGDIVAKMRLAAEEMYKIERERTLSRRISRAQQTQAEVLSN